MSEYKSTPHCKYFSQYNITFSPKFRYSVLKGDIEKLLKNIQNLNLSMVDVVRYGQLVNLLQMFHGQSLQGNLNTKQNGILSILF